MAVCYDGGRTEIPAGRRFCARAQKGQGTAVGRRWGKAHEVLLEGKSRRTGTGGRGRNVRCFREEVLEFPALGKTKTAKPISCSRVSLFEIVELSTHCEARCYQRRAFASLGSGVGRSCGFPAGTTKGNRADGQAERRGRAVGDQSPRNTKPRTRTIRGSEPEHSKREGLERVHLEKITAE